MREEKGITLVALVVMIILLIMIASVGVRLSGGIGGNADNSINAMTRAELSEVQQVVLETYIKYKQTNNYRLLEGKKITYEEANEKLKSIKDNLNLKIETDYDGLENVENDKYYYELTPTNLKNLGVKQSKYTYIVNYSTGEVFNYTAKTAIDGTALYLTK